MDRKVFRDILLLLGVIVIAAVGARILAGGETLSDYARKNPEAMESTSAGSKDTTSIFQNVEADSAGSGNQVTASAEDNATHTDNFTDDKSNDTDIAYTESAESSASHSISFEAEKNGNDSGNDNLADTLSIEAGSEMSTGNSSSERVTYTDGFYYEPISNEVYNRIAGISYPIDCPVPIDELRYVSICYVDFKGETQTGELICNKALAQDLVEIFSELYKNDYQLESVKLVDEFGGDDDASMKANNTSCFNYRTIPGSTRISNHAKGRAIDINPFYNPYITYKKDGSMNISPVGSEPYADRSASFPYKIDENDLAYKLFTSHGFSWGGHWNSSKDYQHFEKKGE